MKKIIASIDGLKYSESTTQYAVSLAKDCKAHLVGTFLDDLTYHSYKIYELLDDDGFSLEKGKKLEEKDKEMRARSAHNFENACQEAGLNYSLHHDKRIAIQELLHESIYADLLVIATRETLTHYREKKPARFMRDLLTEVRCPVLAVPQTYEPIKKIILLYNGEPSSLHAIKMFSYLLPQLQDLNMEVVSVKPGNSTSNKPDALMMEYMNWHYFKKPKYTEIAGDAETEIIKHLKKQKVNSLVVLGFRKGGPLCRLIRENLADTLMREVRLPLFIAP